MEIKVRRREKPAAVSKNLTVRKDRPVQLPKSKQDGCRRKEKSEEIGQKPARISENDAKRSKIVENKAKTKKPKPRKSVPKGPEKSPKEKLNEVAGSKPLKTTPPKKMTGKKKPDDLTPEQRAQLEQPLRKVASPATKEAQEPRDTTDADLEKLKAFFGKR